MSRGGALGHLTVLEFAGLGPVAFAGMMLADHGARVIRIERPAAPQPQRGDGMAALTARRSDVLSRGRQSLPLNLKQPVAREVVWRLIARADVLIEGFRPGVMEALGFGPTACLAKRPALVYGRGTGWGQSGPLAHSAGHDINFTALSGALHSSTRQGSAPTPTPGLIGDFGGGGMLLAFGVLAALAQARHSGRGQVVDAAASDGSALLCSLVYGWRSAGLWNARAGTNNGDGGAHFYNAYQCADGRYVSVGAMEPAFYLELRQRCGLTDAAFDEQWQAERWPDLQQRMAALFRTRTQAQWCDLLEGTDACFAPVLDLDQAPGHPHHRARQAFVEVDGIVQPAPAPKFSDTPAPALQFAPDCRASTQRLLEELGCTQSEIDALLPTDTLP